MSLTPSVVLGRMFERTARKNGRTYFAGRLGQASIAMFKTDQVSESGQPIWEIVVSKPLERADATRKPDAADNAAAEHGFVRESDSEIPF